MVPLPGEPLKRTGRVRIGRAAARGAARSRAGERLEGPQLVHPDQLPARSHAAGCRVLGARDGLVVDAQQPRLPAVAAVRVDRQVHAHRQRYKGDPAARRRREARRLRDPPRPSHLCPLGRPPAEAGVAARPQVDERAYVASCPGRGRGQTVKGLRAPEARGLRQWWRPHSQALCRAARRGGRGAATRRCGARRRRGRSRGRTAPPARTAGTTRS
mmetsp:Transcript_32721/g.97845  ORF Transcript_32721/g.97845 Transcript_32721/m.97845 type:complete len:215 (+) Transcript_32721:128-772(+)